MSILVDKNKVLEITVNGNYIFDEKTQQKKFKESENGNTLITICYVDRDFDSMSKIIEDCSIINAVTGKPLLRASLFIKRVASSYIKRLIIKSDTEDMEIIINQDTIARMHYDFVKFIASKWLEITNRI